jgi:hypothetical protein
MRNMLLLLSASFSCFAVASLAAITCNPASCRQLAAEPLLIRIYAAMHAPI